MIDEFRSSFKGDLAKPSKFTVTVNLPTGVGGPMNAKTLSLRCESATLPGRTLATLDHRIYGPTEKYPYQTSYEDIVMTFICEDGLLEKAAFNSWMDLINPLESWDFEYKKNYAVDINIKQFDVSNNLTHEVTLYEAYPIAVNQLDLDWSSDAPYHKLSVVFAYTYWDYMPTPVLHQMPSPGASTGLNLATALQVGSLLYSSQAALRNGNPYAIGSVVGAGASLIPSLGGTGTVSSIINAQGIGAKDVAADQYASAVNANNIP